MASSSMKVITFAGPPSSGKTAVALELAERFAQHGRVGAIKFDCLSSHDGDDYEAAGIPVLTGVSGVICPDHFFASNIKACMDWGVRHGFDYLITESAGLCNRCSPHLRGAVAVCVIDMLSGIDAPQKIGPMLKLADFIVITKGDLVSQAEREVFALRVIKANPRARVFFINGLTGQGCHLLAKELEAAASKQEAIPERLRFSMPGAVCSYCFGETKVSDKFAVGNIKYMDIED